MTEIQIVSSSGQAAGKAELPDSIFAVEPNMDAVYHAVRSHQANTRRGTASTKTRGEVAGSGAKPWRQKGTGRARAGTAKSPLWTGGGIIFGPKPHGYNISIPRKEKRLALKSALTIKAKDDKVKLIEDLSLEFPKTGRMAEVLSNLGLAGRRTLLLLAAYDRNLFLAGRNIPELSILKASQANAFEVVRAEYLLITRSGLGVLEEVFGRS